MLTLKFFDELNHTIELEISDDSDASSKTNIIRISDKAGEFEKKLTRKEMKILFKGLKSVHFSHSIIDDNFTIRRSSNSRYDFALDEFTKNEISIAILKTAKSGMKTENLKNFCEDVLEIIDAL